MKNNYWIWEEQIPKEYCEEVISSFEESENIASGKVGLENKENKLIRKADVMWLPRMHIVECLLSHHAKEANFASEWNFDLNCHTLELTQIARYKKGFFYKSHIDLKDFGNIGLERKLTTVLFLSDPSTYEGGDLLLEKFKFPNKQGTIVVFPSFLPHEVTKVTKGVRYSATLWTPGPKFK